MSLIRIPDARSARWFDPPPARTAYFSSARSPGVVLRVSVMRSLAPSVAATYAWVTVAIPDRCCRKFSAVRSPASSAAAGPRIVATTSPGCTGSPSATFIRTRVRQSNRVNTASTTPRPQTTARSRDDDLRLGLLRLVDHRRGGRVAAPDVLLERQIQNPLHRRRVPGGRIDAHARVSVATAAVAALRQSCTGQPRRLAARFRRGSGFTTTRLPTRSSIGRSVYESV